MPSSGFKILLVSFSLTACGSAPRGDLCAIDSESSMVCVTPDKKQYVKKTKDSINDVCLSPEYFNRILEWGARQGDKK